MCIETETSDQLNLIVSVSLLKSMDIFSNNKESMDTPWKAHHGQASLKQIVITTQRSETNKVCAETSDNSKTYEFHLLVLNLRYKNHRRAE